MNDVLLIAHLIGLMIGAGGGFSGGIIGRIAASAPPERAVALRSLGPVLARLSTAGLALMWLTGAIMVWTVYGGPDQLPPLFLAKLFFILTLTIAAITIELTYAEIKRGNVKAAARLPLLGPVAGLSSILAVVFAVLTFH
jgi:hypothetical protein